MNYNNKIGILENVKELFKRVNNMNAEIYNLHNVEQEKRELETANLIVESVIDEYNAVIGE